MSTQVLPDYIMRMEEEISELKDRIIKLDLFITTGQSSFLSREQQTLLCVQLHAMKAYMAALDRRIVLSIQEEEGKDTNASQTGKDFMVQLQ